MYVCKRLETEKNNKNNVNIQTHKDLEHFKLDALINDITI